MSGADYLRCKDACVFRTVDRDGRDRNAGRHLRSGEERIDAYSRFVHYWDADNGERRVSRNDTSEMRGASRAADKYLESAFFRIGNIIHDRFRRAMRRERMHL